MIPSWSTADLAVSKWKVGSMHSPHRWSGESGESVKGLPHLGQRGDMTHGTFSQHPRHQELWGRVSICRQPAQLLGRHKSTMTEQANFNPDPIKPSAGRKANLFSTGRRASIPGLSRSVSGGLSSQTSMPCFRFSIVIYRTLKGSRTRSRGLNSCANEQGRRRPRFPECCKDHHRWPSSLLPPP